MKKIQFIMLVITLLATNLFFLSVKMTKADTPPVSLTQGVLGTVDNIPVCHCPDDDKKCYCQVD